MYLLKTREILLITLEAVIARTFQMLLCCKNVVKTRNRNRILDCRLRLVSQGSFSGLGTGFLYLRTSTPRFVIKKH